MRHRPEDLLLAYFHVRLTVVYDNLAKEVTAFIIFSGYSNSIHNNVSFLSQCVTDIFNESRLGVVADHSA